jgi:hypothetical protein
MVQQGGTKPCRAQGGTNGYRGVQETVQELCRRARHQAGASHSSSFVCFRATETSEAKSEQFAHSLTRFSKRTSSPLTTSLALDPLADPRRRHRLR